MPAASILQTSRPVNLTLIFSSRRLMRVPEVLLKVMTAIRPRPQADMTGSGIRTSAQHFTPSF